MKLNQFVVRQRELLGDIVIERRETPAAGTNEENNESSED
jgi:hypothetical protein